MEKKGELFNQLAIVSELLEKLSLDATGQTLILEISKTEFERIYKMVQSKVNFVSQNPENTFNIRIGDVNIVFNKSNV